jgi:diacylglycerol kinase family enzyme
MRVTVIVNGSAGALAAGAGGVDAAKIRAAFERVGVEADVREVAPAEFAATAKAAIARGDDAVVAAGGDGTVSTVAGALAGTDTAFGVLPLGTLNHFARDVGVPSDFEQAVRVIAAGRVRVVDVGEVNGHAFVNNSSIGLYPQMVRRRDAQPQRLGRGNWSAMLFAAIAVFRRFPLLSVRIRGDDVAVAMRAPFVFVGNNAYLRLSNTFHGEIPDSRFGLRDGVRCLTPAS